MIDRISGSMGRNAERELLAREAMVFARYLGAHGEPSPRFLHYYAAAHASLPAAVGTSPRPVAGASPSAAASALLPPAAGDSSPPAVGASLPPAAGASSRDWLVRFARRTPFACALADAYARRVAPYGALRQKLVLVLALLESGKETHASYDGAEEGGMVGSWGVVVVAGLQTALRTALAVVVLAPLHLAETVRRTPRG